MYIKKNTRTTYRSNRRSGFKRNNNFSHNKYRNKGNITQQYNKYLKLAKEASSSSDRIQSEYYYQFTDHYYRLMVELGISVEENNVIENKQEAAQDDSENIANDVEKKSETPKENLETKEDIESIDSIPFISEPPKKKTSKTKKASA